MPKARKLISTLIPNSAAMLIERALVDAGKSEVPAN
jgi:hypothetical protein